MGGRLPCCTSIDQKDASCGGVSAAIGLASTDIGLSQDGGGPKGQSLQLIGTGLDYADFSWTLASASYGAVNGGQVFDMAPVPLPATLPMLLGASGFLAALRRRPRTA